MPNNFISKTRAKSAHNSSREKPRIVYNRSKIHKIGENNGYEWQSTSFNTQENFNRSKFQKAEILMPKVNLYKDREQLKEQKMHLKKMNNKLVQEITLLKNEYEKLKKKSHFNEQRIDLDFQNEMYWRKDATKSTKLVIGIKNQYQNMKEELQAKNKELARLKSKSSFTKQEQTKTYIENLKQTIIKLQQKLSLSQTQDNHPQIDSLYDQLAMITRKLELKQAKIQLLDKYFIEKDNNLHAMEKKLNQVLLDNKNLKSSLQRKQTQLQVRQNYYQEKQSSTFRKNEQQLKKKEKQYQQILTVKENKIYSLEKEVSYLSTLLSYWRPMDGVQNQQQNQVESIAQSEQQVAFQRNYSKQMMPNISELSRLRKLSNHSIRDSIPVEIDEINKQNSETFKKRVMQTAQIRHREEAIKTRKVTPLEIEDISQFVRYRMLAQKIPLQEVQNMFNFYSQSKQDAQWRKNHITLEEVVEILQNQIIGLQQSQALLFGRYLIQDATTDYIYMDMQNQHKRDIVKSILKHSLKSYQIPQNIESITTHAEEIMGKYKQNLIAALSTVAPSGDISRKKLIEMLTGLGIQLTTQETDYLIGKLVLSSKELDKLKHKFLF